MKCLSNMARHGIESGSGSYGLAAQLELYGEVDIGRHKMCEVS